MIINPPYWKVCIFFDDDCTELKFWVCWVLSCATCSTFYWEVWFFPWFPRGLFHFLPNFFFFSLHTVFTAEGKFLRNPQPAMKMYCVYICMHSYICIYVRSFFSRGGGWSSLGVYSMYTYVIHISPQKSKKCTCTGCSCLNKNLFDNYFDAFE